MLRNDASKQINAFDQYYFDKAVPEDHLLRRIANTIDFSFIRDLLSDRYSERKGRPAEEPEVMFKICLLEYLYNHSDVQVIEHIRVNLAYRWFLGLNIDDDLPDDSTISYFRVHRVGLEKFQEVFHGLLEQCFEHGLIASKPGRAIIDSTHVIANAAIPTWLTLVRQACTKAIEELSMVAPTTAMDFKTRFESLYTELKGKDRDEKLPFVLALANELAEAMEAVLPAENSMLKLLHKVISDRNEEAKDRLISVIDTDARTGHKSDMRKIQGYKDHIMIDENSELITAVKVTPANAEDGDQFIDLITQFQANHHVAPSEVSADKGYWFGKNLRFLETNEITGHISVAKTSNPQRLFGPEHFKFNRETMTVTCPVGKTSTRYKQKQGRPGYDFAFTKSQCADCPLRSRCTTSKTLRYVYISEYFDELQRAREHYQTDSYREARKQRWIIERRHADKVMNHGLRRSRYRGLDRTWIHALLSTIASNVKRMSTLLNAQRKRETCALSYS